MQSQFNLRGKPSTASQPNLCSGSIYKKNEAIFYGEKPESRPSSRGSVFQKNAAHFYGDETPKKGERPFAGPAPGDIPPPQEFTERSVLF